MATSRKNATAPTAAAAAAGSSGEDTGLVKKAHRVAINQIPEVQLFIDEKQALDEFRVEHSDVFTQYQDLVDRYNTALEAANAKVRAEGVTCGPFENFSVSVSFAPEKMFDELGEELFLACGGEVGTKPTYNIDTAKVHAAIASKKIPKDSIGEFTTIKRSYHSPKKIEG